MIEVGLRIPAAMLLAVGVFLFTSFFVDQGNTATQPFPKKVTAGLAFLVGLYVNLALRALGGIADRFFGNETD